MRAPPLSIAIGAGLAAALALAPLTGSALGELGKARSEVARLRAIAAAPAPGAAVAPELVINAEDEAGARAAVMRRVQSLATAGGILVEETSAVGAPPGLIALRLRVSGAEKAIISFADAIERERPLVRLRTWRAEQMAGGGLRLIAEAVAPWR